ncbi:serine hydrolase domain-containing protein [Guggenheimella bovis]
MKKIIALLLVVLCTTFSFTGIVFAADLGNLPNEVESFIAERKAGTASVSLGVFQNGKPLYSTQYGYIDEENKVLSGKDTIYEWGSVSKVLVWISLMQLEESGKVDLTKDVKTYLPEDFASKLHFSYPVRLLDIMNLQAGFQEVGLKVEFDEGETIPDLGKLLLESEPKQVFKPGTVTAYNNWTPALAAYVVETVSGKPFREYVQENIFKPLGMNHTAAGSDWSDNPFVKENRPRSKSYYYTSEEHESLGTNIKYIGLYPAGASAGTFEDFLTFSTEFTSDHPRFFKNAETYKKMLDASVLFSDGLPRIHHGLLSIDNVKHLIGHSGNTQGFTSAFWFDPETKLGYVVMTNEPGETAYNYGFSEFLFGTLKAQAKPGTDISGLFTSERSIHRGALRFIKYLNGILPIQATESENVFQVPMAQIKVTSLGNHRYLFDNGNGLAYQVVEKDGGKTLENFTTDSKHLPLAETIGAYGLLIVTLLVPVALLIRFLVLLVKRLRGKTFNVFTAGMVSHIAAAVISLDFIYLWLFCPSYSRTHLLIVSIICILASVVIVTNFGLKLYNRVKGEGKGLVAVTWPLLIPAFAWFYELFNFWA